MTASNIASPTWRATQEYVAKEHLIHYIPESSNTIPLYESEGMSSLWSTERKH